MVLTTLIYIEVATKIVPLPDENSLQIDIYGFESIMKKANEAIENPKTEALGVTHWTLASRAIFYNNKYNSEVYLIDDREDQFDIWQKESPLGKDLIIIDINILHKDTEKFMKCDSVEKISSFNIFYDTAKPNTIDLIKCINYQGLK